ncbi:sugar transferase [Hugonella massiliensis]|uniref:sugar transferase n=1 Tax=Hugonella massiliensis TaxID=1720315 RepID=UPI000A6330E7|nr:sugar transferase [Hugonella massiliensis]
MHSLEFRGTGVFSAPERCDEVVLVTSQQAVALMGEQATEAQITQPVAAAPYGQASLREVAGSEGMPAGDQDALYEGRTVHSGCGYDLSSAASEPTESDVRAARVREALEGVDLAGIEKRYGYRFAKRTFDIAFSALMIVGFCWLFALIAVLIKIDDPKGPVFFKQKRVGKLDAKGNPKYFTMYKFRSMCVDAESKLPELRELNEKTGPVFKIADDPRVTRVGKWLRKLSLDELPQFVNALKGDISIVGPRPALPAEVATYNDYQKQRLLVKPGITCYWQTRRNRDSITFDEWVDLDLLYVKQCSVWADFKLVVQTVGVVLTAQGN